MRRLPPGQSVARGVPVFHAGGVPYAEPPPDWDFRVWGLVGRPIRWTLDDLAAAPRAEVTCDVHCVTAWTALGTRWSGVPASWLLDLVAPAAEATHVLAHAEGGYTANLPLSALREPASLLATGLEGSPLGPEHGAPLRLLVPSRYLWKSAKWLRGLEVMDRDRPGFWEELGYSMTADPWTGDRHAV